MKKKKKRYDSIHYTHEDIVYVPCYQRNPNNESDGSPTFIYCLSDASHDEQYVANLNPDYVLELKGKFDAKTQPFDLEVIDYKEKSDE